MAPRPADMDRTSPRLPGGRHPRDQEHPHRERRPGEDRRLVGAGQGIATPKVNRSIGPQTARKASPARRPSRALKCPGAGEPWRSTDAQSKSGTFRRPLPLTAPPAALRSPRLDYRPLDAVAAGQPCQL